MSSWPRRIVAHDPVATDDGSGSPRPMLRSYVHTVNAPVSGSQSSQRSRPSSGTISCPSAIDCQVPSTTRPDRGSRPLETPPWEDAGGEAAGAWNVRLQNLQTTVVPGCHGGI